MSDVRAADLIAQRLAEAGIRHAFGMPGGEVLTLVDALGRAGIAFHLAKHENAAGFMAEGVWQRTGAPGVLVATVGPGAVNGVNTVANAHQDRVPLIVLTGCVDDFDAETYTHQILDHRAVFAPITKRTFRVARDTADIVADKAISIATEPRPGPVLLDVPISVAAARVAPERLRRRAPAAPVAPAPGPELDQARAWLAAAERPLLMAGLDVVNEGAGTELRRFVEAHEIPFVTTYKAKGIIPESHPLCLGGAGLSPKADRIFAELVAEADLILAAGYDPIEMRTGWREIWDPAQQTIIDIAAVPNDHYMHQASLNIVAEIAQSLATLSDGLGAPTVRWPDAAPAKARAALAEAFPTDEAWGPAAVIDTCRQVLPEATLATVDSGAHRILLSQMWTVPEPRGLTQSTALCTMGCALPLALGAKLAAPERPVVAFMGDAGLLMVLGELATAKDLALPVIVVVLVDSSLALIEKKQRESQLANNGVDFGFHDFAAIARATGGAGHTVHDREALATALESALTADTFTVIAAEIPRGAYDGRF
ncbi:MAG: thiamine pyrophosphate-binding protein [Pseudomonadota bacterium]